MASEYSRHLTTQYSSTTHNKHLFFLKLLFRVLVDGKNPFAKIRPKPKDSTCHEALTQEQLQAILQLAEGELNTFLLVGIYTSLRRKDACLLKWSNLDMDKEIITVTPSKTASRSHKVVTIPIHPQLRVRLETLNHTSEYVMPKMAHWYVHNPAHISRRIKDLFEACGIKTQLEVEGKTGSKKHNKSIHSFHSLRFSMGQNLISNGYTLDQIAQVLGHTTTQMSRHYSTITNEVKTQAILSLPSIVLSEPMPI
jgi:integrase